MFTIDLFCSGVIKKKTAEHTLFYDYYERIQQLSAQTHLEVTVKEVQQKHHMTYNEEMAFYHKSFTDYANSDACIIAFDETGQSLKSTEFKDLIEDLRSKQKCYFLIGGSNGIPQPLKKKAYKKINFGAMTWPHKLVRIMLIEQLYRTVTMMLQHPYHK